MAANQVGKTGEFSLQWYRVLYKNDHFILAILSIRHRLRSSLEAHPVSCSKCHCPSPSDKKPRHEAGYSPASTGDVYERAERCLYNDTDLSSGVVLLNKHTGSFPLLLLHKLRSNLHTNGFLPKVKPAGEWSRTLLHSHKRLQCTLFKHEGKFAFQILPVPTI